MGSAMGQDPELLEEVATWVIEASTRPVWAKMTPNVTHIESPGRAALRAGCHGLSAINTILSVMSVNLKTLRPEPSVEGYTTPGGYSGKAIQPIAKRMVMELAQMLRQEFPGRSLSGIGGIETGEDAAQFILLGANTVQVCTGVMIHGYGLLAPLCEQLLIFMERHGFETLNEFRGHSLQFFTTHADLVKRQAAARASVQTQHKGIVRKDGEWSSDQFVEQSSRLLSND